ncbi:hypothetical protein [Methylomagnum ishizawai]|uniref:hypothetical protein n=1 Tax=Methylomagnum ishizawai TaxID=1760988 RepID=UPI000F73EA5E|nr:hypothetical protein [Methylomagnum ishizawai]
MNVVGGTGTAAFHPDWSGGAGGVFADIPGATLSLPQAAIGGSFGYEAQALLWFSPSSANQKCLFKLNISLPYSISANLKGIEFIVPTSTTANTIVRGALWMSSLASNTQSVGEYRLLTCNALIGGSVPNETYDTPLIITLQAALSGTGTVLAKGGALKATRLL